MGLAVLSAMRAPALSHLLYKGIGQSLEVDIGRSVVLERSYLRVKASLEEFFVKPRRPLRFFPRRRRGSTLGPMRSTRDRGQSFFFHGLFLIEIEPRTAAVLRL